MDKHAIRKLQYFSLINTEITIFSFDGEVFNSVESTKYSHKSTFGLGNYKGKALTTGCLDNDNSDCSLKTEILDISTMKWSDGPDFPFTS